MTDIVADRAPVMLSDVCRVPTDSIGDAMRVLAVRIESALPVAESETPPTRAIRRTLLVTSINDVAPVIACRLAGTLAGSGRQTCLVEAMFRHGSNNAFTGGAAGGRGLVDWLTDGADAPIEPLLTDVQCLKLVSSGRDDRIAADLLRADRVQRLTAELSRDCERIVWAGPPVATAAGMAVASAVDGIVLVISPGRVTRHSAQRARAAIDAVHGRLLGTVLADV